MSFSVFQWFFETHLTFWTCWRVGQRACHLPVVFCGNLRDDLSWQKCHEWQPFKSSLSTHGSCMFFSSSKVGQDLCLMVDRNCCHHHNHWFWRWRCYWKYLLFGGPDAQKTAIKCLLQHLLWKFAIPFGYIREAVMSMVVIHSPYGLTWGSAHWFCFTTVSQAVTVFRFDSHFAAFRCLANFSHW